MAVRLIVDSACDFTPEEIKKYDLEVLAIKTLFGEEEYLDGITLSHDEFFEKLIESDTMPTTSQVAPYEYEEAFERIKASNDEAVCITLSSKLSGGYQSANIALEGYEDCVTIVDSENVCVGERILTMLAIELRDKGCSAKEIAEVLNEKKKNIRLIALLDTLEYLKKGGRISATVAIAGAVLSIKPVIAIENGEVAILGKARGSKNGNNMLRQLIEKEGGINFDMPFCLAYSGLCDELLKKYIKDNGDVYDGKELSISTIGSAIGTHIGPGAIAAAFFV